MKHRSFFLICVLCLFLGAPPSPGEDECENVQIEIRGDFREGAASGPMQIDVAVIRGESCIRSVELYINGAFVGMDPTPPYSFHYDFGDEIKANAIKAKAITFDKKVIETDLVTRDYPVKETLKVQMIALPVFFGEKRKDTDKKIDGRMIQVKVDDVAANVDSLERDHEPLVLGILLDTSRSTKDSLGPIKAALKTFLEGPELKGVPVLLMGFHSSAYIACDLTQDRQVLYAALDKLISAGPTSLYDGIYFAAKKMKDLPGRKVLLSFSDGDDKTSRRKKDEVEMAVKQSDVTVFHVILGLSRFQVVQRKFFSDLSAFHGGTVFHMKSHKEAGKSLAQISEYLKNRFKLCFYPPAILASGIWHTLKYKTEEDIDCLMPSGFILE